MPIVISIVLGRESAGHVSNTSLSVFKLAKVAKFQVLLKMFGHLFIVS